MDKRYQIFVSSTFSDLQPERQIIMRTLMEMGHFPSGMELFSAIDEEQWPFIQKVIDDSDYYVLILGGRYGSLADEEISYTEKEFDYAKKTGKKIIALVHENPLELPVSKTDQNEAHADKLKSFREKVCTGRMVKFWTKPEELAGHLALALPKTIKTYPARGWVRADVETDESLLRQIAEVQRKNINLVARVNELEAVQKETKSLQLGLEKLTEPINFVLQYEIIQREMASEKLISSGQEDFEITYKELFHIISDELITEPSEYRLRSYLAEKLLKDKISLGKAQHISTKMRLEDLKKIMMRLLACSLIDIYFEERKFVGAKKYHLTDFGKKFMAIY